MSTDYFHILYSVSFWNDGHTTPLITPFLPNLLRPNLLRPKVEPFYQLENGLSRWKCSTYGSRLRGTELLYLPARRLSR